MVTAAYCVSLLSMCQYFFNTPILGMPDEPRGLGHQMMLGAAIGGHRDQMVDVALKNPDITHVLFIDDDMGFEVDCLNIALSRQVPVVLGNYRKKTPPGYFTAQMDGEIKTTKESTSLEKCHYGGFGFALIERKVLETIPKPRFLAYYIPEIDTYTTEDLPFFEACHKFGFDTFVDHEISKRLTHNGSYSYSYDDDQLTQSKARNRK
jgi:hypothetical protein